MLLPGVTIPQAAAPHVPGEEGRSLGEARAQPGRVRPGLTDNGCHEPTPGLDVQRGIGLPEHSGGHLMEAVQVGPSDQRRDEVPRIIPGDEAPRPA